MPDDLRTRIAAVIRREVPCHPPAADRIADAVIRELEADRDELVSEAIRDLQERYILVPKSQTLADMAPPRLVINRDCTPLELPAEWKAGMTDDNLRHRIAYAIAQADGDEPGMEPASCDYEMADAVIKALDLGIPCAATGCRMRQIARRASTAK